MITRQEAERRLINDLRNDGLNPDHYNVDALVGELHERAGWDFDKVGDNDFAQLVARHRRKRCPLGWCVVDHDKHDDPEHALSIEIRTRIGVSGKVLSEPGSVQAAVLYDEAQDSAPMLAVAVGQREDAYLTPLQAKALIAMLQRGIEILGPYWTDEAEEIASAGTIFN